MRTPPSDYAARLRAARDEATPTPDEITARLLRWELSHPAPVDGDEQRQATYQRQRDVADQLARQPGITQSELADRAGVLQEAISRYEHGVIVPKTERRWRLAAALEVEALRDVEEQSA